MKKLLITAMATVVGAQAQTDFRSKTFKGNKQFIKSR